MALVDIGADTSLLNSRRADILDLETVPFNRKINFAVGGKDNHRITAVKMFIPAGNMERRQEFVVIDNLRYDVIMGLYLM